MAKVETAIAPEQGTAIVKFAITGVSPLLMHNPEGMLLSAAGGAKTKKEKKIPPAKEAEQGAYRLPNKQLYIPTVALRKSLLLGGVGRMDGKRSIRSILSGSVFTIAKEAPLVHVKTGKPIETYEIDRRRAVVPPRTGASILRARPLVRDWKTYVTWEIDQDVVEIALVLRMFQLAGKIVGVLDNRPGKEGENGRYSVELS